MRSFPPTPPELGKWRLSLAARMVAQVFNGWINAEHGTAQTVYLDGSSDGSSASKGSGGSGDSGAFISEGGGGGLTLFLAPPALLMAAALATAAYPGSSCSWSAACASAAALAAAACCAQWSGLVRGSWLPPHFHGQNYGQNDGTQRQAGLILFLFPRASRQVWVPALRHSRASFRTRRY